MTSWASVAVPLDRFDVAAGKSDGVDVSAFLRIEVVAFYLWWERAHGHRRIAGDDLDLGEERSQAWRLGALFDGIEADPDIGHCSDRAAGCRAQAM